MLLLLGVILILLLLLIIMLMEDSVEIGLNTTGATSTETIATASASDFSIATSVDLRAHLPQYVTLPSINTNGRLLSFLVWGDNGTAGRFDASFKVSHSGVYNYNVRYYIQGSKTATFEFYVNGVLTEYPLYSYKHHLEKAKMDL